MADRFSADPTVVFMTSVLEDLSAGRLHIPRFQRPLVWRWAQRREFFDSIYEGLPIGALMIWISEGAQVSTYDSLGPHPLPKPKNSGETRYLMDGVQRVSTLFGALRASGSWEEFSSGDELEAEDFEVYADLDSVGDGERFVRGVEIRGQVESDPTRYLPLAIILDSRELLRFQRAVPATHEHRVDRADEVASAFRQYKIPLISLNSTSLEVVTKSFERINSRGADMSELHMLNALTYSPDFDLLRFDHELRKEWLAPYGWEEIDSDVVLRCLKMRVGANLYTKNPDEVARRLKGRSSEVSVVFQSLAKAADFLSEQMGIGSPNLVPYRMQLVGLSSVLYSLEWRDVAQKLEDWMWLTTYTEVFGLSARQSENAVGDLQDYVKSGVFKWSLRDPPGVRRLLGLRTDFRSARVKAFAFALAKAYDVANPGEGKRILKDYGREAFWLMPLEDVDRSKAGCRFWIEPTKAASFRNKLLSASLNPEDCAGHLIDQESRSALENGWYDIFADLRAEAIFRFEVEHILRPVSSRLEVSVAGVEDDFDLTA